MDYRNCRCHHLAYGVRLKTLELFYIFGRLLRADLSKCWKSFHFEVDIGLLDGFAVTIDRRTRGYSCKGVIPRCELETRRRFFLLFYYNRR